VLIQLLLGEDIAAALLSRVVSKCGNVMVNTRRLTSHWNETIVERCCCLWKMLLNQTSRSLLSEKMSQAMRGSRYQMKVMFGAAMLLCDITRHYRSTACSLAIEVPA